MSLKWPILWPPSRFLNRVHRKPLTFCLGVLLMAMFSVASADTRFTNISTRASIIDSQDVSTGFIIQGTGEVTVFIKGRSLEAGN
ncbi:secreted protein [Beggiatoa sp. PS]|nr:secreted protein [Beggiatoa sp. PS]